MPSCKSPKEMYEAIIRNLPEKTGRSLEQWVRILKKDGPEGRRPRVEWLKREHGLGHFQATFVVDKAEGIANEYVCDDSLLDTLFDGKKQSLRPLYDALVRTAARLGKDVRVVPCKTYVGLSRKRQFAVVRPYRGSLQLGFALRGAKGLDGIVPVRGSGFGGSDRITHVTLIQDEVSPLARKALELAYRQDGGT